MNQAIAGNEFWLVDRVRVTIEVCDLSTCFTKDDDTGCHIPGAQLDLPESIESASRYITEVQRRASCPAQSLSFKGKSCKVVQIVVRCVTDIVSKAGHQQCTIEMLGCGDHDRRAIQAGAIPCLSCEQFVSSCIVYHTDQSATVAFDPDRHGIKGKCMCKVGCAIEWIDNPVVTRSGLNCCASLFCKDLMGRKFCPNTIDHALFCRMIGVRDQIDGVFVLNTKSASGV